MRRDAVIQSWFCVLTLISVLSTSAKKTQRNDLIIRPPRVVTLFEPEEKEYDSYAAAISAIEPLRAERDQRVEECMNPFLWWWLKVRFGSSNRMYSRILELESSPHVSKAQAACNAYLFKSSRVISSMGLDVRRFNELSHEIKGSKELQRRVMQQAYLYRVASEMDGERFPSIEDLDKRGSSQESRSGTGSTKQKSAVQRFAAALQEIENCRLAQLQTLESEIGTSSIPNGLCTPVMSAVVAPKVKNICSSFESQGFKVLVQIKFIPEDLLSPLTSGEVSPKVKSICSSFESQAETIIQEAGFAPDEFNKLMQQSYSDLVFRWKVNRELERTQKNVIEK